MFFFQIQQDQKLVYHLEWPKIKELANREDGAHLYAASNFCGRTIVRVIIFNVNFKVFHTPIFILS